MKHVIEKKNVKITQTVSLIDGLVRVCTSATTQKKTTKFLMQAVVIINPDGVINRLYERKQLFGEGTKESLRHLFTWSKLNYHVEKTYLLWKEKA
jgi:hypothetical protein